MPRGPAPAPADHLLVVAVLGHGQVEQANQTEDRQLQQGIHGRLQSAVRSNPVFDGAPRCTARKAVGLEESDVLTPGRSRGERTGRDVDLRSTFCRELRRPAGE
jgi:hypothetical protein